MTTQTINTQIGKVVIKQENDIIYQIEYNNQEEENFIDNEISRKLLLYFNGKLKKFDLKFKLEGTKFQKMVYEEVLKIPYGETISYQDLAIRIKLFKHSRAVANALKANKIPIIIPCHRVIRKNGNISGYQGKELVYIKEHLINLEKKYL